MKHITIFILAILFCNSAYSEAIVEFQCGTKFKPKIESEKGEAPRKILSRLQHNPGVNALIPTDPALASSIFIYQQFCNPGDAALTAQCKKESLQDAIDAAVDACKKAAIQKGDDDALYRCKREDCPANSPGCIKLHSNAKCNVDVPVLQCSCGVNKFFEQPTAYTSTVACGCSCSCTASGWADFQCTQCDGTCVQEKQSFCSED